MIEAWKIGVNIAMTSNAAQVLGVIGKDLLGLNKSAEALASKLNLVKLAAVGAMSAVAGGAVLYGMTKLVEKGQDLVQQQYRMREAGFQTKEIAEATAAAWKLSADVAGRGVTENLTLIQGLANMLGEFGVNKTRLVGEATKAAPFAARYETVMGSLGENAEGAGAEFMRFLELRGTLVNHKTGEMATASDLDRAFRLGEAIAAATHGHGTTVSARDLYQYQLQAGAAGATLSEEGLLHLAPLLGIMKGGSGGQGSRVGTGAFQLTRQTMSGALNPHAIEWLMSLGMLDPSKIEHVGKGATAHYKMTPGALEGEQLMERDPVKWMWDVLGKHMKDHGISGPDASAEAILKSGFTATVSRLLAEGLRNEALLRKDFENENIALQVDQYKVAADSPITKMRDFQQAWNNLLTALGAPIVETAYGMLDHITAALKWLTAVAVAHPEATKTILELTAGLAGLAVVLGTLAVGTAAASALLLLGGPAGVLISIGIGATAAVAALILFKKEILGFMHLGEKTPNGGDSGEYTDENGVVHKMNYAPPGADKSPKIQTITYVQLDKRTIAKAVSEQQANFGMLPQVGTSAFDTSMGAFSPGHQIRT